MWRKASIFTVSLGLIASTVAVQAFGGGGVSAASSMNDIVTVAPKRIVDTRSKAGIDDAGPAIVGIRKAAQVTKIKVAGRVGVPADATGAILNLTSENPLAEGYLTAYACDAKRPNTSSLNLNPNETEANAVLTDIGATGEVCVFSSAPTHLIVDVTAYVPADSDIPAVAPTRIVDTRAGFAIDDKGPNVKGARSTNTVTEVVVAGRGGVPADAAGVVLNVTTPNPATEGHLRVYPCGINPPNASNLNLNPGKTDANTVWTKLGPNGSACIYTFGTTDVIVDVNGYVPAGSDLTMIDPRRELDTRTGKGPVAVESLTEVKVAGTDGVPADATGVVLNITSPNPLTEGYVTVYACDEARPSTSNLNLNPDATETNSVFTNVSTSGEVCLFSFGKTDLIVDVLGYVQDAPVTVQILAFNDYHGHLEAEGNGSVDDVDAGGAEYLATTLKNLRANNANSVTVAAGDLIGGSPFLSGYFHDEPSVESLNALGLDISSVGNHEFDDGVTELLRMQNGGCHPVDGCYFQDEPYPGADFPWLAANVVRTASNQTVLPPYAIRQFDGQKVAFIGMTLEGTDALVAATGIEGYEFRDEAETANALVPELKAKGIEAIIVLIHEGGIPVPVTTNGCSNISGPIVAINEALDPEIDAVISGHTHEPYVCEAKDPDGNTRLVTSAYSYGRIVTELSLAIDPTTGDVIRDQTTAFNHVVTQDVDADPAQTAVIEKWGTLADAKGAEEVGTISADINRGGNPPGDDRGVESAAVNLVADAQLAKTAAAGAQIALMNPGGVRSDLTYAESAGEGDGVVTFAEAFTFQPFYNQLVTIPMTGAQIEAALVQQCQPAGTSRPFLHLGVSAGFTYDLSKTVTDGDCTSITVSNLMLNGTAIDPATEYQVTVNNFLADGGDNFGEFATIDVSKRVFGGSDLDALIDYFATSSPVAPPPTDRVNEVN